MPIDQAQRDDDATTTTTPRAPTTRANAQAEAHDDEAGRALCVHVHRVDEASTTTTDDADTMRTTTTAHHHHHDDAGHVGGRAIAWGLDA